MQEVAIQVIRENPLTYLRLVLDDARLIFTGDPIVLRDEWRQSRPGKERAKLTTLMRGPTPEQERWYPVTERIVNAYQSARLGPILPILFAIGLVASAVRPRWRLALLPGLTVLGLNTSTAAAAGYTPRFHHPSDPIMHVVAFGGIVVLWTVAARSIGRFRTPPPSPSPAPAVDTPTMIVAQGGPTPSR